MPASKPLSFEPISLTVDGLCYAGLVSGPEDGHPVLALHGWLDNANSFHLLARLLPELRIAALDLSGHGLSDARSADATYQIWDDLPQLVGVLDALGWESCSLLGHSRGAIIGTLLAAALPERISSLITLDSMLPAPVEDEDFVTNLRGFLVDRAKLSGKTPRVYASRQAYVARRGQLGEPAQVSSALAERALKETGDGLVYRNDARLRGTSAIKLNARQSETVLRALTMPVLNVWAVPTKFKAEMLARQRAAIQEHVADVETLEIEGHHHWHMEEKPAARIADAIRAFLKRSR